MGEPESLSRPARSQKVSGPNSFFKVSTPPEIPIDIVRRPDYSALDLRKTLRARISGEL